MPGWKTTIISILFLSACSQGTTRTFGEKIVPQDLRGGDNNSDALPEQQDDLAIPDRESNVPELRDEPDAEPGAVTTRLQGSDYKKVDLVFVVDTSGSMKDEVAALQNNMNSLINNILDQRFDIKVIAIGGKDPKKKSAIDFSFPNVDPQRFGVINRYVHSAQPIGVLSEFFQGKLRDRSDLKLRPGAKTEVVIITDDNGSNDSKQRDDQPTGNTAADLKIPTDIKKEDLRIHAIVGLEEGKNSSTCNIPNVGTEHQSLAKQTKGLILDICTEDWGKLTQTLAEYITKNETLPLDAKPDLSRPVQVLINGEIIDPNSYVIDADEQTLSFPEDANPPVQVGPGDEIEVRYFEGT